MKPKRFRGWFPVAGWFLVCLGLPWGCPAAYGQPTGASIFGVAARHFQYPGDWTLQENPAASGGTCLTSGASGAELPAATEVEIPRSGRYYLWVRAMDFPTDRPGTRRFKVSVGAQKTEKAFGGSGQASFTWESGGTFELTKGPLLVGIHALTPFARADAVLFTTDPKFKPTQRLGSPQHPAVQPGKLTVASGFDPLASVPVTDLGQPPAASLENEGVRIEFMPSVRGGKPTLCPRVAFKTATGWSVAPADVASEIYAVVAAAVGTQFSLTGVYPAWKGARTPGAEVTVEAGGVKLKTAPPRSEAIWNAGELLRLLPRSARTEGGKVQLEFYPSDKGALTAQWELRPGEHTARVKLAFKPLASGEYALGYHLFFRQPLAQVKEILLPFMWHRHRLPERPRTLFDPFAPTPVSLAETTAAGTASVWGVVGDPAEIPAPWPGGNRPHFGLMIRDEAGAVQPSIYGPVPGTDAARRQAGEPVQFAFRVLLQQGDWYAGYRTAADEVFGLRDYRRNTGVSLTDAALNMIDLLLEDQHGGWWERAKGWYQIESKNGATHASPLTLLSLYRLTGNSELYRRRALPTMEFVLSRRSPHFSPVPDDTGHYDAGGMDGPTRIFGTTTFGGFWELTQRRTAAFRDIALPDDTVRPAGGHSQTFSEWLARYEMTGETNALQKACELADRYLAVAVNKPPATELGMQPFFYISFEHDWEGLLHLYEATRKPQYLEASAFGARLLMTGIWTQPAITPGDVVIHPGGQFPGEDYPSWRGAVHYRLGAPRRTNDTPEHRVPAWTVSAVGMGFEQPSTIRGRNGHRLIYQMAWAPEFLRLAEYTGDRHFETYARNAVIGRWGNYPGYYLTGFTDLPFSPRYPLDGPDVTDFYYHHIAPHLAWTLDYLVAEASLRSGGRIRFPAQRQVGYAYFDSRVYGHAPGRIFDSEGAWLWFRRGVVTIDNPQLNYLMAHTRNEFFLILMNENSQAENARIRFSPDLLRFNPAEARATILTGDGKVGAAASLPGGMAEITVSARGLMVLRLTGVDVRIPTHVREPEPAPSKHPGYVRLKTEAGLEVRAAALQSSPGPWDAYVWCTASAPEARRVALQYRVAGAWQERQRTEYPFEFSVPVAEGAREFQFRMELETANGRKVAVPETTIGVAP